MRRQVLLILLGTSRLNDPVLDFMLQLLLLLLFDVIEVLPLSNANMSASGRAQTFVMLFFHDTNRSAMEALALQTSRTFRIAKSALQIPHFGDKKRASLAASA